MFNRNLKPESYLYFACQLWVLSLFVVAVFPFSVFLIKLSQIRMQRGKINHYEFQKSWRVSLIPWTGQSMQHGA